jgi:catechol 2,3-dioxygenase-like lactoylglutathione lyase family enzyme
MFTKITLISIPVINQQVAKEFYTDVLGCRIEADIPFGIDGRTRSISLKFPGVDTRLSFVTWFPQMPPGSAQGIVLATDEAAKRPSPTPDGNGKGWILQQPSTQVNKGTLPKTSQIK